MRGKQLGFSDYEQPTAMKLSKREKLHVDMDQVVSWQVRNNLIEQHYPRSRKKGGRSTYPLATILQIHLKHQWPSLSEPRM